MLVLASSSTYRRTLIARLGLPFTWDAPDLDETELPDETPHGLVTRLSEGKARAVAARHPNSLIIGSDQVSVRDGMIIGKPHTHEKAIAQLAAASGKRIDFLTGLCLLNSGTGRCQVMVEPFSVIFRTLSPGAIERYLRADTPYDCAGSFKLEGRGIALFERLEGRDPNTLIGLPLIALVDLLAAEGVQVP